MAPTTNKQRAALLIATSSLTVAFTPLSNHASHHAAGVVSSRRGAPLFVKRNKGRKNRRSNYEADEDWYGKPATAEDTLSVTPVSGDFFSQFARNRVGAERDSRRLFSSLDGVQGEMSEEEAEMMMMDEDEDLGLFGDEKVQDDGLEDGDEFDLDSVFEEIEMGGNKLSKDEEEELGIRSTSGVVNGTASAAASPSSSVVTGIPLEQSTGAVTWSIGDKADPYDDDFMDDFENLTGDTGRAAAAAAKQRIPGIGLFDPDAQDDESDGAIDAVVVGEGAGGAGAEGEEDNGVANFETEGREYLYSPSLEKAAAEAAAAVAADGSSVEGKDGVKRKLFRTNVRDPANNAVWVSGVHQRMAKHTAGVFETLGIEFAANFDDYLESQDIDDLEVREIAALKARELYRLTGLPAIAERTGFKVDPTKRGAADLESGAAPVSGKAAGYQFNAVGASAEKLVAQLSMFGDEERYCTYSTVVCAFDGENTIYEVAEAQVSLMVAEESKMLITISTAMAQMGQRLQKEQQLRQNEFESTKVKEDMTQYKGAIRMREMVLKEGKVLPNQILDVSSFMNSLIDVDLMWDAAEELSARFVTMRPTKILTVATSGLILAIPMGKILQVPVVYARKERSVVMSDTYAVSYSSKTSGSNKELLVSKRHIDEDDRVLLVDDFLSSGAAQEALMRIVAQASATPIGVAVLLEKAYESGRMFLSGYDCSVESLVRVLDVNDGAINVAQDDDNSDLA